MSKHMLPPAMPIIYVAGPFRGATALEIERNVRRAEDLATLVWMAGAVGWCPHTNTRFLHGTLPDEVFIKGTKAQLARCDGIIMVPGWETSDGSRGELEYAMEHNMPVFHSITELERWLGGLEIQRQLDAPDGHDVPSDAGSIWHPRYW